MLLHGVEEPFAVHFGLPGIGLNAVLGEDDVLVPGTDNAAGQVIVSLAYIGADFRCAGFVWRDQKDKWQIVGRIAVTASGPEWGERDDAGAAAGEECPGPVGLTRVDVGGLDFDFRNHVLAMRAEKNDVLIPKYKGVTGLLG